MLPGTASPIVHTHNQNISHLLLATPHNSTISLPNINSNSTNRWAVTLTVSSKWHGMEEVGVKRRLRTGGQAVRRGKRGAGVRRRGWRIIEDGLYRFGLLDTTKGFGLDPEDGVPKRKQMTVIALVVYIRITVSMSSYRFIGHE